MDDEIEREVLVVSCMVNEDGVKEGVHYGSGVGMKLIGSINMPT